MRLLISSAIGLWLLAPILGSMTLRAQPPPRAIALVVDETDAARQLSRVHEDVPVQPGTLALAYPKWIPGEHGPTGPLQHVGSLRIRAGTTTLPWTRDDEDIYTVRVDVPSGATQIAVDFDVVFENTISDHQLLLAWSSVLLYPAAADKTALLIAPSVVLPAGWARASALPVRSETASRVDFATTSLERLIDSPVLAGEFLRSAPLASAWPATLDITADSLDALDKADDGHAVALFGALVDQDQAMFGFRHWKAFHVLVSQSDARPYDGLEHEDSPYNAVSGHGLSSHDELEKLGAPLLAHEQSHSWIGKYRRPAELYSKTNYQGPERTSLLWVYEGLNQYVSTILATRAGFNDAAYARDELASWTSFAAHQLSRAATPLADTAVESSVLRAGGGWAMLRRSQDYYFEGALTWLQADAIIRTQSKGARSLDTFLRRFFGERDTGPIVAPYTRQDIESALSAVCPYDWHQFFETRIYQANGAPPTGGLEAAGWRLVYDDTPNRDRFLPRRIESRGVQRDSIGLTVATDGAIDDVVPGSPAYEAGLGPRMTVVAVDGRAFSMDALADSIAHPANGRIALLVRNFASVQSRDIRYAGGLRYPHLERIPAATDYLSDILTAQRAGDR
jgi:predicted metalloprotease with PDZ domain